MTKNAAEHLAALRTVIRETPVDPAVTASYDQLTSMLRGTLADYGIEPNPDSVMAFIAGLKHAQMAALHCMTEHFPLGLLALPLIDTAVMRLMCAAIGLNTDPLPEMG